MYNRLRVFPLPVREPTDSGSLYFSFPMKSKVKERIRKLEEDVHRGWRRGDGVKKTLGRPVEE